ncbi:MAG: HNH endonuclease [Polyangiales bacterium]
MPPVGETESTRYAVDEWVAEQQAKAPICGCGCGATITVLATHRKEGIPRFRHGHHMRLLAQAKAAALDDWVAREQGQHVCVCGCGEPITIRRHHRKAGVPRFRFRHGTKGSLNPRYSGVDAWVSASQSRHACACGCGSFVVVLPRHHSLSVGVPRFIQGHHKKLTGRLCAKFKPDRASLKSGRAGRYFYKSLRLDVLRRDGGRCVQCGSVDRVNVDHIVPVVEGGAAEMSNGQVLCHDCHAAKTRIERRRARVRRLRDRLELEVLRSLFLVKSIVRHLRAGGSS